jgi:hypothetical protein
LEDISEFIWQWRITAISQRDSAFSVSNFFIHFAIADPTILLVLKNPTCGRL